MDGDRDALARLSRKVEATTSKGHGSYSDLGLALMLGVEKMVGLSHVCMGCKTYLVG